MPRKTSDILLSIVSPASSSSSNSSTDDALSLKGRACCPICGGISHNKHFGLNTCNACKFYINNSRFKSFIFGAAFFRRTIAHQRRYTCVRGKQCLITFGNARHLCRFCRFQRCIVQGMNISAVFVRSTDEYKIFDPDSPLKNILLSQRATFVNRYTAQLKAYGGNHNLVRLGVENPTFKTTLTTISSEFSVLKEYLLASNFKDLGLNASEFNELAYNLFYSWICYHSILAILRNAGHKTGVAYFIDESHIKVNDEDIIKYIKTLDGLKDYRLAAEATKRFFTNALECANQIHSSRMEEAEHALMFHIFALKIAAKLYPDNKKFGETINELFSALRKHYEKNFDDTALKLGNIVLMMSALEKSTIIFNEYISFLFLSGYNTVLPNLASQKETFPDVKIKVEQDNI